MYVEVSKDYPLTYQINYYLMKTCSKCNEVKELNEFYKEKNKGDGRTKKCIQCIKNCYTKYRKANPELLKQQAKKYYGANKDAINVASRAYYRANKTRINKQKTAYEKNKYHTDPTFRTERLCRRRIQLALAGKNKSASTLDLLGCTAEHARFHIESQFTEGMTWDNIHIDHIQPCASFDLEDPNEQRKCFHYTNLQPLLAEDNLRKSDSIVPEHQVKLL